MTETLPAPPPLTPAAAGMWESYLRTLPTDHPHRRATPDVVSFGDSPALADELAALVVDGRKRATASLPVEFTALGQPLPRPGDLSVVTRGDGEPVAIIVLTEVREVPFAAVDTAFAAAEGEGDGSLAWWQTAHRGYFDRIVQRLGGTAFDETTVVLCQCFRVLWRGAP